MVINEVQATGESVDARMLPRDRERGRRVEQDAEVVAVIGPLVEVPEVGDHRGSNELS